MKTKSRIEEPEDVVRRAGGSCTNLKSHTWSAVAEALRAGLPVFDVDTSSSGNDDIVIMEPGDTEADVRDLFVAHFELDGWPEDWSVRRIALKAREVGDVFAELLAQDEPAPRPAQIMVDEENNGEEWWDAVRAAVAAGNAPLIHVSASPEFGSSLGTVGVWIDDNAEPSTVYVNGLDRARLVDWFASLPGWDDGPEYAPHPLAVEDVDE